MLFVYRPIGDGYRHSFMTSGTGKPGTWKRSLMDRIRLRRRRRRADDLECLRGW